MEMNHTKYYSLPWRRALKALLVIALLMSVLLPAVSPAYAATCTEYYTVKRGDTLFKIGLKYGVTWNVLADLNDIDSPGVIYTGQKLCVSVKEDSAPDKPATGAIPTFSIVSVSKGQSVTIQTANFPANDSFDVLMGEFGTRAVNGIKVDRIGSGQGGAFKATFSIPADLASEKRIAIRLQSSTGSGYFAYNWFTNSTAGGGSGDGSSGMPGYSGYPTFKITGVVRNSSVTIRARNLPANVSFDVRMGEMGTGAVNGIKVDRISSGGGGETSYTFAIPEDLRGLRQIAIRIESPESGYYAFNWFYNNSTE